jgi:excisionase family DNA binding protein
MHRSSPSISSVSQASDPTPHPYETAIYTPAEAAQRLKVGESWLRRKAAARLVPCTFIGKHLRFTTADIAAIIAAGARPTGGRKPRRRARPHHPGDDLPNPSQRSVHAHRDDPEPDGSTPPWHG